MGISSFVTPNDSIKSSELLYVRSVVPKQGIVMPTTLPGSLPESRAACVATSSARVESSPPETPITGREFVISIRFLSPATCIEKISLQRSARSFLEDGTKGSLSTV